jgi:nitrogen regulatory protein P-II 1
MIMIEATIKPFVLDKVREALSKLGISNLTEYQVSNFGADRSHKEIYRGTEYVVESVPRVKLDVVVSEAMENQVVEAIATAAKTAAGSDGTILVLPISKVISIGDSSRSEKPKAKAG